MRNFILTCILLLGLSVNALAQNTIVVTGLVTDTNKEPLIGANVSVSDTPGLGVITDVNGKFTIKTPPYSKLVFSYIGYDKVEVLVKEQRTVNVTMKESESNVIDEIVITGTGDRKSTRLNSSH